MLHRLNNRSQANGNNHLNNNTRFVGIAWAGIGIFKMGEEKFISLYTQVCSYQNLLLAFQKARKGKTKRPDVIEFESNLKNNLLQLRADLLLHSYCPQPLTTFIIRDPKTRKINKSAFRDRIVHHALCNILEPIASL